MKPRLWILVATSIAGMVGWAGLVFFGTIYGWWLTPIAPNGDARAFADAAVREIETSHRGNAAFVLIEKGKAVRFHGVSVGQPVDRDTLFQVSSLSKWISAWGVMALVEAGKLDLDRPVSSYLKRWSLPKSEFNNDGVSVRRLLSHTAGLTDGLGYAGFPPGTAVQSLEASLTRAADASPQANGSVGVGLAPGSQWRYSGGGYTLLQLLIEEVSGEPFDLFMKRTVLQPLGMTRSTFVLASDASNVAEFFDANGRRSPHYRFASLAATSLYTSASDMTHFIAAHVPGPAGEPAGRGVLTPATVASMRTPLASQYGAEIWGLGTMLYAPNGKGDFIVGHDGTNEPAINTTARLDPSSGDGIVILETGNRLLATELAGKWVYWKIGSLDVLAFYAATASVFRLLAAGWTAILIGAGVFYWTKRRLTYALAPADARR